jgi:hypothetical protein
MMQKVTPKKFNVLLIAVVILLFDSCAALLAGFYLASVDSNSGSEVLHNEPEVRQFLAAILLDPQNYTMYMYERRSIAAKIPKTKLLHHEFYSIHGSANGYHTISFYGTDMRFRSEGAWILDGNSDFGSLKSFLSGENNWQVVDITPQKGLNVEKTVSNVIKKIDSTVRYYFRDHLKDRPNADNCVTALTETYVENE